ncbi:MAG: flagellar hook assembly protein FlgD [Methylophilus sp.]|nr:flagellar hook assembly protein FlgD [Methylophilus sp.]
MTTVQNANNVSQALLDSVNGSKSKKNGTSVDDVQNRFMTLLVTQMKNQDPLNPMDNAQVTSQMAQLSTVTGIDKLNATVESLISSVQTGQSYQASSMIGHNVLVAGDQISNTGTGGYFGVELPNGADKVSVNIKNSAGAVVRTVELGSQSAGTLPLAWDGYATDGSVAPSGSYKVEVSATVSGKSVEANALSYSKVLSVSNSASGITLNLNNDTSVSTSEVKEIF